VAPFDAARSGFVLAEGGFGLWLRHDDTHSNRRGEILGVAAAGAAVPLNAWPEKPDALVRTMSLALEDAGLTSADVDVVYASANATRALDSAEADALSRLFQESRPVVTSVKGALGEAGVGGAASCAAAFLCGRAGWVPPIAGLQTPDPSAAQLNLARAATPVPGPVALVNSFASGGALYSAVLRVAA
jgi:3-oxoacyl-[acyl-carrier-protein] synthase II